MVFIEFKEEAPWAFVLRMTGKVEKMEKKV
jgi:hypothetical protein